MLSSLIKGLLAFLSLQLPMPDGSPRYIRHCSGSNWTCEERVQAFASYFEEEAIEGSPIDPALLAAMAMHESSLNPAAVSRAGAMGIMGLMPRYFKDRSKFLSSRRYRRECLGTPGACQQKIVRISAQHLKQNLNHCKSLYGALQRYNTGGNTCNRNPSYAKIVLRFRTRLLGE